MQLQEIWEGKGQMLALIAKAFVTCGAESREREMLPSKFLNLFEEFITKRTVFCFTRSSAIQGILFS